MRRGEVRLVDLDPARGSEADKLRPAVIVSNDGANSTAERLGRGVLTMVPVTSRTERVYPFQVMLPARETGLRLDSKAQAEQVRAVAQKWLDKKRSVTGYLIKDTTPKREEKRS